MVVVAVAGGTGKLGRAIVEALVSDGRHDVLILARAVSHARRPFYGLISHPCPKKVDEAKQKEIGARIVATDYSNVDELSSLLSTNNVDTVIASISGMAGTESETNLIKAADKSAVTKRYIPSLWGIKYSAQ